MQDYGGPVGFRMILAHPETRRSSHRPRRRRAQRGPWAQIGRRAAPTGADRAAYESALRTNLLSLPTTRRAPTSATIPNVERHDPDLWTDEYYFLNQPGQADIQSDLFYDYRTNVENYPKWQA